MKTIYKYPLRITDDQIVLMPKGAEILKVHQQGQSPCIWARVNTESINEKRRFRIFGTGHEIITDVGGLKYLDSVFDGALVWHVYEVQPMWL